MLSISRNRINIKLRKKIIISFFFFFIFIIMLRYYNLQIIQYENYKIKSGNNSVRKIILNAPRGLIFDRNNKPIVDNQLIYDISIIPTDFNVENFNYDLMNSKLSIKKEDLNSIVLPNKRSYLQYKPILIKRQIDFDTKSILEEHKLDLKGLYFSDFPARKYSSDCRLTHVLGYLRQNDKDDYNNIVGFSGLENYYESLLRGEDGVEYHLVDRHGIDQGLYDVGLSHIPMQGDSLILTIDRDLQAYCEKRVSDLKGAIIVMEPESGEILSLASFPDYKLDSFIGPIPIDVWTKLINDKDKPFNNRAIQNTYPPGSIFKLILGSIALEYKIVDLSWQVQCNGIYDFHGTQFACWKEEGHGVVNLSKAIQKSCNIYFYNLMQKVDFDLWHEEVVKFGYGAITDIDLPYEKEGLIPNKKYMNNTYRKRGGWSKGHLLNLSIGQGETLVTPMQIINSINLISNEGYILKPHLRKDILNEKYSISYNRNVFVNIKNAMYDAVYKTGGTAYNAKIKKSKGNVYGKTGTVQLCTNCDIEPHAWFAGILEMKNGKKYSICVLIENGGKGSNLPAKISKDIFNYMVDKDV